MRTLGDDRRVLTALADSARFHTVEHHASVTSTNDVALAALRDGASPGLVVVADRQTRGRGRRGRPWSDDVTGPVGPANLAVTATIGMPGADAGLVPLAVGSAVARVYAEHGATAVLKWPNDVLLDGRKAAGILVERHHVDASAAASEVLLLGCGLDLDWRAAARSGEATHWTSLAEVTGADVDRGAVLAALLRALSERLRTLEVDPAGLRAAYAAQCATLGATIEATLPDGSTIVGRAAGIDGDGRLRVEHDGGRTVLTAADVVHLRPR